MFNEKKIESLDIETIWVNGVAIPICISITDKNKVKFKLSLKPIEIIEFMLENCKNRKIYYVHNLTFECFVFIRYLVNLNLRFKIVSSNRIVYQMYIYYKKKKIVMRCSWRLTMLSLKNLSLLADVEEKDVFPYKILNDRIKKIVKVELKDFNEDSEYNLFIKKYGKIVNIFKILEDYCINDSLITKKSMINYWKIIIKIGYVNNLNILTAARLSIESYFNSFDKVVKKIGLKYDKLIRKAYYGGRTEVFGNPYDDEICLHFDFSGMYGQCMMENIPDGKILIKNVNKNFDKAGFYLIKFEQNMDIPILPYKKEKLIFCNGIIEGWYWYEEILLFIKYGGKIIEIKNSILCKNYGKFLKEFVEKNNDLRKKGGLYKLLGKNNNNTLYGRLGMNPEKMEESIFFNEIKEKNFEKIIEVMGIKIGYSKSKIKTSNVMVAAAITSKARIKLYEGFKSVEENGGRILYCDTDSIIAAFKKDVYKDKLDKKFGEIIFDSNLSDTIIEDCVFCLPKTYALKFLDNEVVKIKGFNVKPNYRKFKYFFYNNIEIETKNKIFIKKNFQIEINEELIKKTNLRSLEKRKWSNDLKKSEPLKLN